jgi:hypothetical protein
MVISRDADVEGADAIEVLGDLGDTGEEGR